VQLWHFDHPNLYASRMSLEVGGRVLHARRDRFGIRKVDIKPDGFYLNGERVRVPGFNRVSDSNTTGNTEPDELVRRDVDLMKSASAVFSRLMHSPQATNLQDYMDERGLMTVAEIPIWGRGDPQVFSDNPLTKQWLREMIERDYNHPSVVGWSTGNEILKHTDYVRTMNDTVRRELDPHRFVGYASFTAYRGDVSPRTDGLTHSDLSMFNIYAGKGQDFLKLIHTVRRRWPEKPIFLSEFGVEQIGVGDAARVPNLGEIWAAIGKEPYVIGGALWTLNDYRSDYPGTPASGNREWGVVDVDRNLKPGYAEVQRAFAPVRALSFAGSKIRLVPRALDELPSYALKGYTLRWTERAAAGAAAKSGVIKLPDLQPGAGLLDLLVEAGGLAGVTLVSPTGYSVLEATPTP
jgi:beta-galactosidase